MSEQLDIDFKPDHVGGGFEWEREPSCSCGRLTEAVRDGFIFVSNISDGGSNIFYIMPVGADGSLFRSKGIAIGFCPWCGDKIVGHKRYSDRAEPTSV